MFFYCTLKGISINLTGLFIFKNIFNLFLQISIFRMCLMTVRSQFKYTEIWEELFKANTAAWSSRNVNSQVCCWVEAREEPEITALPAVRNNNKRKRKTQLSRSGWYVIKILNLQHVNVHLHPWTNWTAYREFLFSVLAWFPHYLEYFISYLIIYARERQVASLVFFKWLWARCWVYISHSMDLEDDTHRVVHSSTHTYSTLKLIPQVSAWLLDTLAWISLSRCPCLSVCVCLAGSVCEEQPSVWEGARPLAALCWWNKGFSALCVFSFCFRNSTLKCHQKRQHVSHCACVDCFCL